MTKELRAIAKFKQTNKPVDALVFYYFSNGMNVLTMYSDTTCTWDNDLCWLCVVVLGCDESSTP